MTAPAIMLRTVRRLNEGLPSAVRRVADCGFDGVVFSDRLVTSGADTDAVSAALSETGTVPVAAHVDFGAFTSGWDVVEPYLAVGCSRVVVTDARAVQFRTPERVRRLAGWLDDLGGRLRDEGVELCYHNGVHEFDDPGGTAGLAEFFGALDPTARGQSALSRMLDRLDGKSSPPADDAPGATPLPETAFGRLLAATDPSVVAFDPDVVSIAAAGYDPVDVLGALGSRAPLVHFRERRGSGEGEERVAEDGRGPVDLARVAGAARTSGADWLVYEHEDPVEPAVTVRKAGSKVRGALGHTGG